MSPPTLSSTSSDSSPLSTMGFWVLLPPFVTKILDVAAGELKHLRRPKPRIEELKETRANLQAKEDDINNRIRLAQLERETPTNQVQQWLREVEELKGKAAATEQDFQSWRCLCGWSWNCFSVNRRVAKRMKKIDNLLTRADATLVSTKTPPPAVVEIPMSDSTFGMEAYMSEIMGYIASPNATEVIGIYGMGGVGKTTLLMKINNHRGVATKFDHVILAVASRECKMEKLQEDIAKCLGLSLKQNDSAGSNAADLNLFLKNKDCLLLLDDLWKPVDPKKLGMDNASSEHGKQKRKVVVFTTRYERICGGMETSKEMKIKCLKTEEAWKLFQSKASGPIGSDPGIKHIARQIAEECAGLPLALITVGAAMSRMNLWEEWSHALKLMKRSEFPQVTGEKEEDLMFSAFKLSYNMLQDDEMRGCLLSCALWPEDHSIKKEELIECWMGLNLIREEGMIHEAYEIGLSHIETLKASCLLEPGNDKEAEVKMHDVIRDMVLWMTYDCDKKKFKWIVSAEVAASTTLQKEGWHEAERVSLMYNGIASLPFSTCSKLTLLMLQCNWELNEIRGTLIQAKRSLTYLDLNNTGIAKIPNEISMLSKLQHLNLSNTPIKVLPAELGNLVNLKYLFLRGTRYLSVVDKGGISNLSLLRLLDLRGSALVDCSVCWDELEALKGCLKSSIGVEITTASTLQRLYSLQHVLIWRLDMTINDVSTNLNQLLDGIMKCRNIKQSVEQLRIRYAPSKQLLIIERNEEAVYIESLKFLSFSSLYTLEDITWKGVTPQIVFPNLRELRIHFCPKLKNVNWVLQLPCLIVLDISYCNEMVELISDEGGSSPSCVGLRKMILLGMKKLTRISRRTLHFPNSEKIVVRDCPHLKKLPIFGNRLKVIQCEQKWWNNLEFEDKNSLSHLVVFENPTVGMEEYESEILSYIASPNACEIIGIYGMGGVGKTTLLKSINNHSDIATKFDHVIWVVASKECNMEKLHMDIADRLGLHLEQDDCTEDRAYKIYNFLKNKNCLLLLDDLWEPVDLAKLGMVHTQSGHEKRKVVVFTTRFVQVCRGMHRSREMQIKCLKPEEAWLLFQSQVSGPVGSDPRIEHIAHQIAEECGGLPRALITIGEAMSRKNSWEEWRHALKLMKRSQILQVTGKEEDLMFHAFKLSYHMLADDEMRGCHLSCAIWPKNHSINKEELIECWMGLDLINEEGAICKAYYRGLSHIETLKAACLLEPGNDEETEVKMHEVIRDMALWMANDGGKKKFKWIVRAGDAASRALEEEGWQEAERVSLMYNDIASLPYQLPTCSKLTVLMLQCNEELKEIRGTLIQAMLSLMYLDLSNTEIAEIPKEISILSQLRYLNLSNTPIIELPAELGSLVNLKYLLLRHTYNLNKVAKGAISGLSSLKLLDLRGSKYEDCWDELNNLQACWDELKNLQASKKSIAIDIKTATALGCLCSLSCVLIWRLNVKTLRDSSNLNQLLDDIINSRNTRQSMDQLRIEDVEMNEFLISEGKELECMKNLELFNLNRLEEIKWNGVQPFEVFPCLRELIISGCQRLRNVNWALKLPSLRILDISCCEVMEELISDEGKLTLPYFGPERITLSQMPKLKRISATPLCFPFCKEITVLKCPFLINLSFEKLDDVKRLKKIRCVQACWDNLEWEDDEIKGKLLRFVKNK